MIRFEQVTITYEGADTPAVADVNLHIDEGEMMLVVGRTGSGKSTLLRAINGLVPHFTGGTLQGRVTVDGRDTRTHPPRDLADVVGMVPQNPMSSFVTDTVEEELAYSMECLGIAPAVMRRRVEETLDLLGLTDVRERSLLSLSGGQRQRVAIGAVLTAHPRVLVLDEPTSALDPGAAEEVLATVQYISVGLRDGIRFPSPCGMHDEEPPRCASNCRAYTSPYPTPSATASSRSSEPVPRTATLRPCEVSPSMCRPARSSRSWAATGPASPLCCPPWSGYGDRMREPCGSTASTRPRWLGHDSLDASDSYLRSRRTY